MPDQKLIVWVMVLLYFLFFWLVLPLFWRWFMKSPPSGEKGNDDAK